MPFLIWSEALSVGVRQLDDDHQIMFEIINELYDAMRVGQGDELLEGIFSRLKAYTFTHFLREEALMKSYEYPHYVSHKKLHEDLIKRLDEFMARYSQDRNLVSTIEISQFLQDWLLKHIKQEDFQYKKHFQDQGLT